MQFLINFGDFVFFVKKVPGSVSIKTYFFCRFQALGLEFRFGLRLGGSLCDTKPLPSPSRPTMTCQFGDRCIASADMAT
jgi:hypothetical protein